MNNIFLVWMKCIKNIWSNQYLTTYKKTMYNIPWLIYLSEKVEK